MRSLALQVTQHRSRPLARGLTWVWLSALVVPWISGCGRAAGVTEVDVDLTERLVTSSAPLAAPQVLAVLAPADDMSSAPPWTASAPAGVKAQAVYSSDERSLDAPRIPASLLLGRGVRTVQVALAGAELQRASAVRALVGAYIGDHATVSARWLAHGVELDSSGEATLVCRGAPHLVVLRRGVTTVAPDTLELRFDGPADAVAVCRLELLDSTLGDELPAPIGASEAVAGGPRLYTVGTEQRNGLGLVSGRALHVDVAPAAGVSLEYSITWPRALRRPRQTLELTVEYEVEGDVESTTTMSLPPETPEAWTSHRLPLGATGARGGRLGFRVSSSEGPAALVLADVRLVGQRSDPPTVVLVTSDTHRGDHLGLGDPEAAVATPHLDRLARRGVVFLDALAPTNVTNPSHAALMTGLHPRDLEIVDNHTALAGRATTLAERFSAAGYRTFAAISAQHLEPRQSGLGQGFQRFEAPREGKRAGAAALDVVERWLDEAEGQPVFLWLHLFDPHTPYTTRCGRPATRARVPSSLLGEDLPEVLRAPWMDDDARRDAEGVRALYRGEVETVDDLVGRLLARERVERGVFAFTADHGEALGDNGVWFSHAGVRRATLHVPLIVVAPSFERWAGTCRRPVRLVDLGRTLLREAGVDHVGHPGRHLSWALEDPQRADPRFALSAYGDSAALESEGWLLVLHLVDHQRSGATRARVHGEVELYDLAQDPAGLRDVLEREPERAARMRAGLIRWLDRADRIGYGEEVALDTATEANLSALGYAVDAAARTGAWWRAVEGSPWNARFER